MRPAWDGWLKWKYTIRCLTKLLFYAWVRDRLGSGDLGRRIIYANNRMFNKASLACSGLGTQKNNFRDTYQLFNTALTHRIGRD